MEVLELGKTLTSVYLAIRSHKKSVKIWKRKRFFHKITFRKFTDEKPLLYSNIPLFNYDYVLLDNDLILRNKRFNFHSVVLISETSLMANSMDFKDKHLNSDITEWLKLIRHSLHGSYRSLFGFGATIPNLILETQSKNDNHFAFDRALNQVLYINKSWNLPFFKLVYCRDLLLIDSVENVYQDDSRDSIVNRWYLVPKKYFKYYDSFCYSFLTDKLSSKDNVNYVYQTKKKRKKLSFKVPTFHKFEDIENNNDILDNEGIEYKEVK